MSVKNGALTGVVNDGDDFARCSIGMKGNTLYFFTDTDLSEGDGLGLLPTEVGQILHDQWGLTNVVNLDGGGSTQMAIRTAGGVTYYDTPESPDAPRPVGTNLAVYATNAPSTFNTLDDFETTNAATGLPTNGTGHFYGTPEDSGSNVNINSNSTVARITTSAHTGSGSLQLKLNDSSTTAGFQERFLSAAAHTYTNVRFASSGYFGFWLQTSTPNLTVSPVIDDDFDGSDLVEGTFKNIISDGQWHLYQWNMADNSQWQNYFQDADGHITNPGVNLNSIWFDSSVAENAVINFDDLGWTESGPIPAPEPTSLAVLLVVGGIALGRRRGRPFTRLATTSIKTTTARRAYSRFDGEPTQQISLWSNAPLSSASPLSLPEISLPTSFLEMFRFGLEIDYHKRAGIFDMSEGNQPTLHNCRF